VRIELASHGLRLALAMRNAIKTTASEKNWDGKLSWRRRPMPVYPTGKAVRRLRNDIPRDSLDRGRES